MECLVSLVFLAVFLAVFLTRHLPHLVVGAAGSQASPGVAVEEVAAVVPPLTLRPAQGPPSQEHPRGSRTLWPSLTQHSLAHILHSPHDQHPWRTQKDSAAVKNQKTLRDRRTGGEEEQQG